VAAWTHEPSRRGHCHVHRDTEKQDCRKRNLRQISNNLVSGSRGIARTSRETGEEEDGLGDSFGIHLIP